MTYGGFDGVMAVRERLGAAKMDQLLKATCKEFRGRPVSSGPFLRLASECAGDDLEAYLAPWLRQWPPPWM